MKTPDFNGHTPEQRARLRYVWERERTKTVAIAWWCLIVIAWDAVVCLAMVHWFGHG